MSKNIQILDCTLRDGGLGLEDAEKNDLSHVRFSENDSRMTAGYLADSAIDIIELGSIEITSDDRTGFCIYQNIEDVSKQMPLKKNRIRCLQHYIGDQILLLRIFRNGILHYVKQ